ncbi:MAG: four helix bundle protein [Pyrinomonadaceae bacterium]
MDKGQWKENPLRSKSYSFALRIVKAYKYLASEKKEFVLSKQLLRSGTSIGANVAEANQAQSRADFISKLSIALKEAVETEYWLCLLRDAEYITADQAESLLAECLELVRMLTSAIKTAKDSRNRI